MQSADSILDKPLKRVDQTEKSKSNLYALGLPLIRQDSGAYAHRLSLPI